MPFHHHVVPPRPFNRTTMELKPLLSDYHVNGWWTFNRTTMELKRGIQVGEGVEVQPFNRTTMELKHAKAGRVVAEELRF